MQNIPTIHTTRGEQGGHLPVESMLFPCWLMKRSVVVTKMAEPVSPQSWSPLYLWLSLFHSPSATKGQRTVGRSISPIAPSHIDPYGALFNCIGCTIDLCCGKHFTRLASILVNSLLLIMYFIDQFGPRVNWSIILIFFFFFFWCGIKWGTSCSGLNVCFSCSLRYCKESINDLPSSEVIRYHSKYAVLLKHVTNANNRQAWSVFANNLFYC